MTIDLWQTIVLDRPQLGAVRSALRIDGILRVLEKQGLFIDREDIEQAYLRNSEEHWKMQHNSLDQSFNEQVCRMFPLTDYYHIFQGIMNPRHSPIKSYNTGFNPKIHKKALDKRIRMIEEYVSQGKEVYFIKHPNYKK